MSDLRIVQLEEENKRLKEENESLRGSGWDDDSSQSSSNDNEMVDFLAQHQELTLELLKCIYETLSELKRQNPSQDFKEIFNLLTSKFVSHEENGNKTDHIIKELELARHAQRTAEKKLQLLRERHQEELNLVDGNIKEDQLSKNKGLKEYLERLTERKRVNDDLVERLRKELNHLKKENDELKDRCQNLEKKNQEHLKNWRDPQRSCRGGLETNNFLNSQQRSNGQSSHQRLLTNRSPVPSFDENYQIPPPMDEPQLDEILRDISMHDGESGQQRIDETIPLSFDSSQLPFSEMDSIPPPPEVQMEEIFKELNSPTGSSIGFSSDNNKRRLH